MVELSGEGATVSGYSVSSGLLTMDTNSGRSSWIAFALFYITLILIVTLLDVVNDVFRFTYWGTQVLMVTVGVGVFVIIGRRMPDLSAARGILLAFTVGILTIIPAVLMGLGQIPDLWPQYFYIAFGMAAGSFLTFLFLRFSNKMAEKQSNPAEKE